MMEADPGVGGSPLQNAPRAPYQRHLLGLQKQEDLSRRRGSSPFLGLVPVTCSHGFAPQGASMPRIGLGGLAPLGQAQHLQCLMPRPALG